MKASYRNPDIYYFQRHHTSDGIPRKHGYLPLRTVTKRQKDAAYLQRHIIQTHLTISRWNREGISNSYPYSPILHVPQHSSDALNKHSCSVATVL
jgi:hypothetical protein